MKTHFEKITCEVGVPIVSREIKSETIQFPDENAGIRKNSRDIPILNGYVESYSLARSQISIKFAL